MRPPSTTPRPSTKRGDALPGQHLLPGHDIEQPGGQPAAWVKCSMWCRPPRRAELRVRMCPSHREISRLVLAGRPYSSSPWTCRSAPRIITARTTIRTPHRRRGPGTLGLRLRRPVAHPDARADREEVRPLEARHDVERAGSPTRHRVHHGMWTQIPVESLPELA